MVAPGLNLSGLCQNMNCNAFKKFVSAFCFGSVLNCVLYRLVWVRKGVGIFTLSAMKDRLGILWAPCPECKTPTKMTGMGFCECLWEAWGGKVSVYTLFMSKDVCYRLNLSLFRLTRLGEWRHSINILRKLQTRSRYVQVAELIYHA